MKQSNAKPKPKAKKVCNPCKIEKHKATKQNNNPMFVAIKRGRGRYTVETRFTYSEEDAKLLARLANSDTYSGFRPLMS